MRGHTPGLCSRVLLGWVWAERWMPSTEGSRVEGRASRCRAPPAVLDAAEPAAPIPVRTATLQPLCPPLLSAEFHLQYSMLLSLLRVEGADPEQLMWLSYRQFQTERALPALEARVARFEVRSARRVLAGVGVGEGGVG